MTIPDRHRLDQQTARPAASPALALPLMLDLQVIRRHGSEFELRQRIAATRAGYREWRRDEGWLDERELFALASLAAELTGCDRGSFDRASRRALGWERVAFSIIAEYAAECRRRMG